MMTLAQGTINKRYQIKDVNSDDSIKDFLLTLGCFAGEDVTIITKLSSNLIINVKDAKYSIDENLAKTIII